jgi:hypothetical protein
MINHAKRMKIIHGNIQRFEDMIDGESEDFDGHNGFAHFKWPKEIIFELDVRINNFKFKIKTFNRDDRRYKYKIFLSEDNKKWIELIDRSVEGISGWDEKEYSNGPIKFVKLHAMSNSRNAGFHIVQLEIITKSSIKLISNSYKIYNKQMNNIKSITNISDKDVFKPEIFQFLLAQSYANIMTSIEVYLKDMIINAFQVNVEYIHKFIKNLNIKKEVSKDDLIEVICKDKSEFEYVKEIIDNIVFHNFEKIKPLYDNLFDIDILDFSEKNELFKMRILRHDIIHRNCKNHKGEEIKLDTDMIYNGIELGISFIKRIDEMLSENHSILFPQDEDKTD